MELPGVKPGTLVTVLIVPANVPIPAVDANAARSGEVLSGDEIAQELQHRGAHPERHPLAAGN